MAIYKETEYVEGLEELEKALDSITNDKFRKRVLRKAGKEAMKPVLNDAIGLAPVLTDVHKNPTATAGALKADIKMTSSVRLTPLTKSGRLAKNKNELLIKVKTGKATENYALVTEYGREPFTVKRTEAFGRQTREYEARVARVHPRPWLRPALYKNKHKVVNKFKTVLWNEIFKQAKKEFRANKRAAGKSG